MKDNSAYMIRLELLKLAQSIESERTMNIRIQKENDWHSEREMATSQNKTPPPFPVIENVDHVKIIAIANSLNDFVSKGIKND